MSEWDEAVIQNLVRGERGGSFFFDESYFFTGLRNACYYSDEVSNIGFRVAYIPESTTLSLLALSRLAVMRRIK
ncbi:MAG: hypothetical protein ACYTBZ_09160 [Planctomycetota bacterium]